MFKNLDHAEKIHYLTLIIRSLCDENNLNKNVVIDDFIYVLEKKEEKVNA